MCVQQRFVKVGMVLLFVGAFCVGLSAQPQRPPVIEQTSVTNPTSGASLFVQVYQPTSNAQGPYTALVLVPGGSSAGSQAFRAPEAQRYADLGFVVVVFDPDGRGRSGGVEDYDGYVHQDGLKAVIEFAAAHPGGNGRVVLASFSYGVTMATGALARYEELPVDFYLDWEGPANRNDTGGCDGAGLGHLQSFGCDNEPFWAQREAATFMRDIRVPYQRLQSAQDHVQPDNRHAILLINNATNSSYGGQGHSPWTRLNDQTPNRVYPLDYDAGWLSEEDRLPALVEQYLEAFLAG